MIGYLQSMIWNSGEGLRFLTWHENLDAMYEEIREIEYKIDLKYGN